MAKKKRSTSAAPRRYYAAPKKRTHRKKSGTAQIPAAGATIGLVYANKFGIKTAIENPSKEGIKTAAKWAIQPEQLKRDAVYMTVGMIGGAAVKKFAPNFIKAPLGKI